MSNSRDNFKALFSPFERTMTQAGMPALLVESFRRHMRQLLSGAEVSLSRKDFTTLGAIPDADTLGGSSASGLQALRSTVLIKLNGGLGTSMGLERAKSLIPLRDGLRFLDIIARQALTLRRQSGFRVPLLFLDSATTQQDTLEALSGYDDIESDIPISLLQHLVPKVLAAERTPASQIDATSLAWCPPGHGDLYLALQTSGLLDTMLERGYRYAFVSNADNLGAVLDTSILGYFVDGDFDFLMEVADRTAADRKGGHLARLKDGRLTLRERAQCPDDEAEEFQNIDEYRYFNTNSLWLNLLSLRALIDSHGGILPLPLIQNEKTLDPRDPVSPRVYQLETAMGAAISLFDRATALRVPRTRFAPVKTTDDLLAVRSDAMVLDHQYRITPNPERILPPIDIRLDPAHYRFVQQLDDHFPHGAPSLLHCSSLQIQGDVRFGAKVALHGAVRLSAAEGETLHIPDNDVLKGS
jgi:UTP--glucose-1-phosphate uridylyltransferase